MTNRAQQPEGQSGSTLPQLNTAIDALSHARGAASIAPAKAALTSAGALLTSIRDSMANKPEYVELGLACADTCDALVRGMERKNQFGRTVLNAIEQLTVTVNEIQKSIDRQGKRIMIARLLRGNDKEAIGAWRSDLSRILRVFSTELVADVHRTASTSRRDPPNVRAATPDVHHGTPIPEGVDPSVRHDNPPTRPGFSESKSDNSNIRTISSDSYRDKQGGRGDAFNQNSSNYASAPGESPPLPKNTHGASSSSRRDVVSEVHRDVVNTQTLIYDIHNLLKSQEGAGGQFQLAQNSAPGEAPPPPPRVFFGRDDLIEKIVYFAERLTPVALIGAGGIGKTSIILTVIHDSRIKRRFGDNSCFIRCDQFPATRSHFLRRLSKAIGVGIENPEDLTPLRRFLSSKEMLIVLDNAESILDPQGTNAQEIYAIVDELTRFNNVCLCITSRISTIPPSCETLEIPTLSKQAGHDTFYRIYKRSEPTHSIGDVLEQLDFHPLAITLLATVAQYNHWDTHRLTTEWERQRTGMLDAHHSGSLAATIELSLASRMFRDLGPDARGVLGVIAFFPQGVDERNINWLLPTVSGGQSMFDKFCILSLTYRIGGFVTMLAPLRDYLRPDDPMSSSLLCITKERYFSRLSINVFPDDPDFKYSGWVTSEDLNVEHLIDVFTSYDANSTEAWDACAKFAEHLSWHKPRPIMLGPKIEALPDNHPRKPHCMQSLGWLFESVGNQVERKRLFIPTIKLWRERGNESEAAFLLGDLADANRLLGHPEEGIQQAKEALQIFERLNDQGNQAECLINLARILISEMQIDAAEEAATRAISLLPEKGQQHRISKAHRVLGYVHRSKGRTEEAIHHLQIAQRIATSLKAIHQLFWVHFTLADLFGQEGKFRDAHAHVELAKSHVVHDAYNIARASLLQAGFWETQRMFEEAKSESLRALDVFEKLGADDDAEYTRELLERIDREARRTWVGRLTTR